MKPYFVLGSASKERLRLIQDLVPLEHCLVEPGQVDESIKPKELPKAYVTRVAQEKALKVSQGHKKAYVLGADTIVSVGTRILRKAKDEEEAKFQISLISGRRHRVYTAVALYVPGKEKIFCRLAMTHVALKRLSQDEINLFLQSQEWKGVAVYKIQGLIGRWMRSINGLSTTVQGLPVFHVYQMLQGNGFPYLRRDLERMDVNGREYMKEEAEE